MSAKTKTEHYYGAHNVVTRVSFSARQRSLRCGQNLRMPFLSADDSWIVRSSDGGHGRQKGSLLHHQGEFLHSYSFVSLHDSDHDGVVRIFVALSSEL